MNAYRAYIHKAEGEKDKKTVRHNHRIVSVVLLWRAHRLEVIATLITPNVE